LTEKVGQLARVREYFSVQVKSSSGGWSFDDAESVEWFVHHPLPLFLCTVDKKRGVVCVYHTLPRFQIWALGTLPPAVNLLPGDGSEGTFDPCPGFTAGQSTSPSACCEEPGKSLGPELF